MENREVCKSGLSAPEVRFYNNLDEAHRRITSGKGLKSPRNSSTYSLISLPSTARLAISGALSAHLQAQDDLELRTSVPHTRRASIGSSPHEVVMQDPLARQIDDTIASFQEPQANTSGNTIERILDEYSDNGAHNALQGATTVSVSAADPHHSMATTDTSSITNSQHLLDAEAQILEIEEARNVIAPQPLDLTSSRFVNDTNRRPSGVRDGTDNDRRQLFGSTNDHIHRARERNQALDSSCNDREPDLDNSAQYEEWLKPEKLRSISQVLSGSESMLLSPRNSYYCNTDSPPSLPEGVEKPYRYTISNAKMPRNIDMVIGHGSANRDSDADWITEPPSEAGFSGSCLSSTPAFSGFKATGSSIAGISDQEDDAHSHAPFASRENLVDDSSVKDPDVVYRRRKSTNWNVRLREKKANQTPIGDRHIQGRRQPDPPRNTGFNKNVDSRSRFEFPESMSDINAGNLSNLANYGSVNTRRNLPLPDNGRGGDGLKTRPNFSLYAAAKDQYRDHGGPIGERRRQGDKGKGKGKVQARDLAAPAQANGSFDFELLPITHVQETRIRRMLPHAGPATSLPPLPATPPPRDVRVYSRLSTEFSPSEYGACDTPANYDGAPVPFATSIPNIIEPHWRLSYRADKNRRRLFWAFVALSIIPFFAALILLDKAQGLLAWATDGECRRLSKSQRKVLKWVFAVECMLCVAVVVGVSVYAAMKAKMPN
ncbi:hypothetical protein F5Y18DRAFT_433235 [Xylariaceae sp. FL1019]|nr:hypothetical protein F5Y18DRAFT_433235 [Xylariaceae sp. FL1019]